MDERNPMNEWLAYRDESYPHVMHALEFNYSNEPQKSAIAEGMTLWTFCRKGIINKAERRAFLLELLNTKLSASARLIAMIECLPDRVWRKHLWKDNLDFLSFESFLRRITRQQMLSIEASFHSLYPAEGIKPTMPKVMKKNLWNRIKNVITHTSAKSLLEEDYNLKVRNMNKPAWAFNLLQMDFGFSLYPQGENDDTMITNKKWTRFLSIKAHINDFVVNKDSGKYWWFYRTARSNYVLRPKKDVQMKDHVCPGFWATFILHFLFWIASPVLFTIGTILIVHADTVHAAALLPMIPTLITPLWIVIASIKFCILQIAKIPLSERQEKVLQIMGIVALVIACVCVVLFCAGLVLIVIGASIVFFSSILGYLLSVAFVLTMVFFLCVLGGALIGNDSFAIYRKFPKWMKRIAYVSLIAAAIRFFDIYAADHVVKWIISVSTVSWEFISEYPWMFVWIIIMFACIGVSGWLTTLYSKNKQAFAITERITNWTIMGMLISTGLCWGLTIIKGWADFASLYASSPLLIFISMSAIVFAFILLKMSEKVNSRSIVNIELAQEKAEYLYTALLNMDVSPAKNREFPGAIFLNNTLTAAEFNALIDKLVPLTCRLFYGSSDRHSCILAVLPSISNELIDKIAEQDAKLRVMEEWEALLYIEMLAVGWDPERIMENVIEKKEQKRRAEETGKKINRILVAIAMIIAYPFIQIGRFFVWIWRGISHFALTLKDIWDLFNKRCPFLHKEKLLE